MRRMRKSIRRRIWGGVLFVTVQVLFFFLCQSTTKSVTARKYETVLKETNERLEAAGRTVYITTKEVKAGELLTEDNTEKQYLLSEQNPEALSVDAIGMTACANLPVGVILNKALCSESEYAETERRCLFDKIGYAESFLMYDMVDVRIRYANGENYCVLKRKRLQDVQKEEAQCGFFLTEAEQLLMSAAQYDVEVYEGAEIYLVGFGEERLQEDAVSAYVPSVQVLSQLQRWDTEYANSFEVWCDLRIALENRLSEFRMQRLNGLL